MPGLELCVLRPARASYGRHLAISPSRRLAVSILESTIAMPIVRRSEDRGTMAP
jgi:hypothetical protein